MPNLIYQKMLIIKILFHDSKYLLLLLYFKSLDICNCNFHYLKWLNYNNE